MSLRLYGIVEDCKRSKSEAANQQLLLYIKEHATEESFDKRLLKDYVCQDNMSFYNEYQQLNDKAEAIGSQQRSNKELLREILELKTYFREWDITRSDSQCCNDAGNKLLDVISKSRNKKQILDDIHGMSSVAQLSNDVWTIASVGYLIFAGYVILRSLESAESQLASEVYLELKDVLKQVFTSKSAFLQVYWDRYASCLRKDVKKGGWIPFNFKEGEFAFGPLKFSFTGSKT